MKITKIEHINDFLSAVEKSAGDVWLHSPYGDRLNLKSQICQYVAIAGLLGEYGDTFELFCDRKEDEQYFFAFFKEYPEVLYD